MAARNKKTSPPAPSRAEAPAAAAPLNWTADWTRQQMAVAAEGAAAVFRGFQAMRAIQEEAAQQAASRHAGAAEKMRKAGTPLELLALQGELARADLESAARYWQQLTGAALEMNTELAGCATQLVDTEDVFGVTAARFLHS